MPIYEYRCQNGHTFEVMQRISDDPVASCSTCEAPVQRVFHPVAVHFKGSGFYNTDYGTRKRSREKEGASEGSESKSGDNGASGEAKKSENGAAPAKSDAKATDGGSSSSPASKQSGD